VQRIRFASDRPDAYLETTQTRDEVVPCMVW
jgi:hypothetical protein